MALPTRSSSDKNASADINSLQTQITALSTGVAQVIFYIKGNAYVDTKVVQALMGESGTITKVRAYADTAPDGADLEIDFNKNGVSIMNTVLTVEDGANAGNSTDFTGTPSVVEGDRISVDIDQVGSTTAGGNDLMIAIEF